MASITALEKSANIFAKWLRAKAEGLTVEVDVFRTGPGGNEHYGPSTVTMDVELTRTILDADGNEEEDWCFDSMVFIADEYTGSGPGEYEGRNWGPMKQEALKALRQTGFPV